MARKVKTGLALVLALTLWGCSKQATTEVSPQGAGVVACIPALLGLGLVGGLVWLGRRRKEASAT